MSSPSPPPPPEDPINPYAAPAAEIGPELIAPGVVDPEAEAIRRAHIGHEASIKSLGLLHYFITGMGLFIIVVGLIAFSLRNSPEGRSRISSGFFLALILVVYFLLSGLSFTLGRGLRGLRSWARWTDAILLSLYSLGVVAVVISAIAHQDLPATISFLVVLLIVGYILYLLLSTKGSVVFSPAYKEIIARTPHIKYRTSLILKIVLVLFVSLIGMAILGAILSSR